MLAGFDYRAKEPRPAFLSKAALFLFLGLINQEECNRILDYLNKVCGKSIFSQNDFAVICSIDSNDKPLRYMVDYRNPKDERTTVKRVFSCFLELFSKNQDICYKSGITLSFRIIQKNQNGNHLLIKKPNNLLIINNKNKIKVNEESFFCDSKTFSEKILDFRRLL